MWYNITQYKNTIEDLEPQTYSPVCLELWIFLSGGGGNVLNFFDELFFFFGD